MSKAFVTDSNAVTGPRMHEIITQMAEDGKTPIATTRYTLSAQGTAESPHGLEMPLDHAMQFLKDPAFVVRNEKGDRINPIPVQKDGGTGSLVLKADEVIAKLHELTNESLYKRAKSLPGADGLSEESAREDLIAFLFTRAQVKNVVSHNTVEANAQAKGLDVMQPGELDRLFAD